MSSSSLSENNQLENSETKLTMYKIDYTQATWKGSNNHQKSNNRQEVCHVGSGSGGLNAHA